MLNQRERCTTARDAARAATHGCALAALSLVALMLGSGYTAMANDAAHDFVEVRRTSWGQYFLTYEINASNDTGTHDPFTRSRLRIVGADGTEHGQISGHGRVDVSFADLDGDAVIDLVLTGNSGGVTGCCDFMEVWTLAAGAPQRAFMYWGGRGQGDTIRPIPGQIGEPIPILTTQYLYVGDLPFCCLPSVPRAFVWDGLQLRDVSRASVPDRIGVSLGENRSTVRHLTQPQRTANDVDLLTAAIGAYAAAFLLDRETAENELLVMEGLLPRGVFERLTEAVPEVEDALKTWLDDRLD